MTTQKLPFAAPQRQGFPSGRTLRPSSKLLPEHARGHNRSLVLQALYQGGQKSRADIARETGLTRVTISDLVSELIGEGLVLEMGQREDARPGKPATLLELNGLAFQIVGIDLSEAAIFRGAVLDLRGRVISRADVPLESSTGADATEKVIELVGSLVEAATLPVLGIGVGSPGVVDLAGVVLSAPNLGWVALPLHDLLAERYGLPVVVINDANAAALAEHSFGGAESDMMVVKVGHGVGAGLLLGGSPLFGSRFAAGEIGHVVVGTDGGAECACGKQLPRDVAGDAAPRRGTRGSCDIRTENHGSQGSGAAPRHRPRSRGRRPQPLRGRTERTDRPA